MKGLTVRSCDVMKEDLKNLVARISKEKYINLLITDTGISGPKAELESEQASELNESLTNRETFSEWSDTFNINVLAVYVRLSNPRTHP